MTANEFGCSALVARADTTHQFLVRIPHGLEANSEKRSARPVGQPIKAALLSNLMHPAAAFAERYCSLLEPVSTLPGPLLYLSIKRWKERLQS
jgi:hypothetical protein